MSIRLILQAAIEDAFETIDKMRKEAVGRAAGEVDGSAILAALALDHREWMREPVDLGHDRFVMRKHVVAWFPEGDGPLKERTVILLSNGTRIHVDDSPLEVYSAMQGPE